MGIAERKEREKEQRRNDIIDAAEQVFFSKGFEQATMDEVAERVELSKGTLYLYFKNKEELQFAISIRALQLLKKMLAEAVDQNKSTWENLLEIGRAYIAYAKQYHEYFRTIILFENKNYLACCDPDSKNAAFGNEGNPMEFFVRFLNAGINDGSIRSDISPAVLGHILWTQTTGVLKLIGTKDFHEDLTNTSEEEIINGHLEIVYHGVKNCKA